MTKVLIQGEEELKREITNLSGKLDDDKKLKRIFRKNAKPYIVASDALAPKNKGPVFRYSTPKINGKLKAPKGRGVRVAIYSSGNLGRSIRTLRLRRAKKSIHIGPGRSRGSARGIFNSKNRYDGYYAFFVAHGTKYIDKNKFLEKAWNSTSSRVIQGVLKDLRKLVLK